MKKIAHYQRLIFLVVFLLTYIVAYFCMLKNPMLRTVFAITFALILSPRKRSLETQNGVKTQITWLFLKEPIIID
ncbi:MAG: hypothetical protein ABF265_06225 [Polaribacter sp.]|jgi:hypothetical protein